MKMHRVSWDRVTAQKDKGGLGLGSLKATNVSLLARWWLCLKNDKKKLLRNIIWALHSGSRSWQPIPAKLSMTGVWKNIYKIDSDLLQVQIDISELLGASLVTVNKSDFG
jgi:hypothetical protein